MGFVRLRDGKGWGISRFNTAAIRFGMQN